MRDRPTYVEFFDERVDRCPAHRRIRRRHVSNPLMRLMRTLPIRKFKSTRDAGLQNWKTPGHYEPTSAGKLENSRVCSLSPGCRFRHHAVALWETWCADRIRSKMARDGSHASAAQGDQDRGLDPRHGRAVRDCESSCAPAPCARNRSPRPSSLTCIGPALAHTCADDAGGLGSRGNQGREAWNWRRYSNLYVPLVPRTRRGPSTHTDDIDCSRPSSERSACADAADAASVSETRR